MSSLNQDVHSVNYLILNLFGDHSGAFSASNFFAPELLTTHLRKDEQNGILKKQKAHKNTFCELSSVLICQSVIPLEC